jgi:hypothetical protein
MVFQARVVETGGGIAANRGPDFAQNAYRRINIRISGRNSQRRKGRRADGAAARDKRRRLRP